MNNPKRLATLGTQDTGRNCTLKPPLYSYMSSYSQ